MGVTVVTTPKVPMSSEVPLITSTPRISFKELMRGMRELKVETSALKRD